MKVLTTLLSFFFTISVLSQKTELDNYYTKLDRSSIIKDSITKTETLNYLNIAKKQVKPNVIIHLSQMLANYLLYTESNHRQSFKILKENESFIKKATNTEQIGKYYIAYADAAIFNQQHSLSLEIAKKGIDLLEKHKDSSLYEFGYSYLKAAETSMNLNRFTESAQFYQKAEQIFEHQKDTLFVLWSKNGLGTLFSNNGLLEEAEETRAPIYALAKKINQEQVAAMAHISSALNASFLKNKQKELYHTREALRCKYKHSDIYEIVNTLSITFATAAFARNQKKDSSNYYLNRLESKIKKHKGNTFMYSYYLLAKAYNSLTNHQLDNAEKNTLAFIKLIKHNKADPNYLEAVNLLAKIYEQLNKPDKALFYYKQYKHIGDSLNLKQSKTKFAYTQSLFEAEKKDLKINNQQQEIKVLDLENKQRKQTLIYSLLIFITLLFVTYLILTKIRVRKEQKTQKEFSQNLITTQENERARLARELHDGIGQQLILLKKKAQQQDANLGLMTNVVLEEMRGITKNLHPSVLKQLGLTATLKQLINTIDENTELFFTYDINQIDELLSPNNEVNVYRIIQECINNILKHANATAVEIDILRSLTNIVIKISDNGTGFNVEEKLTKSNSLGLQTLKERVHILNGKLNISSNKSGTTIKIYVLFT